MFFRKHNKNMISLILFMLLFSYAVYADDTNTTDTMVVNSEKVSMKDIIQEAIKEQSAKVNQGLFPLKTSVIDYTKENKVATINFSQQFAAQMIRPETIERLDSFFLPLLKENEKESLKMKYLVEGDSLETYIPRWYLKGKSARVNLKESSGEPPLVYNGDKPVTVFEKGLFGKHVAIWASHGWYYDATQSKRWEWQRPRMFSIAEDTQQAAIINNYVIPMLENAGAVVFSMRERDQQTNEVIVDNDDGGTKSGSGTYTETGIWDTGMGKGFKNGLSPYELGFNPHEQGTNRVIKSSKTSNATAEWIPMIPEDGEYGVTVSYIHDPANSVKDAHYTVYHAGGKTTFLVNQTMGGGTWVYLGKFRFKKGMNKESGSVVLSNESKTPGRIISADAVRFGGGMGSVLRGGETSGYPRYAEAALYSMQYAGAPAKLVYDLGLEDGPEGPDYTNDYSGRGEFVNWLCGSPAGPNGDRANPGLGIPVDCAIGLHTDAGISKGIIGFLSIYYLKDQTGTTVFPDGRPRTINREFADLVQSETIDIIRNKYSTTWTKRELKNSSYSEARRPNVPSCLIEGFSHQNFNDMKYALDPRFRFDYARGIYKGILKFIASEYNFEPVVQPLPPVELSLVKIGPDSAILSWSPQTDPLEITSEPEGFMVYQREGDGGFDNGTFAKKKAVTLKKLDPMKIYSFKVTAINRGGESFASETISICLGKDDAKRILIVNGFDRISAPQMTTGDMQGVRRDIDRGVGYMATYGLTGDQWDFNPKSEFKTNDNPGHGASFGDLEDKVELGNTFDFVYTHGRSMVSAGYGFDSSSHKAVESGIVLMNQYAAVDWILGEQREILPPEGFEDSGMPDAMKPQFKTFNKDAQDKIRQYTVEGGKLFITGAYVATDLSQAPGATEDDKKFLKEVLKAEWSTNFGSRTNNVMPCADSPFSSIKEIHFSSGIGEEGVYGVEAPDAIEPAKDSKAVIAFRYKDARFAAGIAYKGDDYSCVVLGFPFETITSADSRNNLMAETLKYLINK